MKAEVERLEGREGLCTWCGWGSLRGVGHLPHDDMAALSLGQHRLHLADVPHTLLRLVILAVTCREDVCDGEVALGPQQPGAHLPMRKSI